MAARVTWLLILLSANFGSGVESPTHEMYDTIIVGLGAAGTTAASTLARAGRRVLALEASARVGGRVRTERFGDGVVELGAEWIHGQFPSRVYDLAVKNHVDIVSQDLTFDVYRSDGSRTDIYVLNELVMYCFELMDQKSDKAESLGHLITTKFKDYLQWRNPELYNDKDFVDNFLVFMNLLVNNHEATDDWGDVTAQSNYEELRGDQHLSWHRHGYKTFFDILLNKYNNGPGLPTLDIKLNKEVTNITWPKDSTGDVVVKCKDGDRYTAHDVIVTVSLGVLKERHASLFSPGLPSQKVEAINTISIGVMDKVIVSFEEAWWHKNTTFFGFLWRNEERGKVAKEDYWMTRIFGASTPMGSGRTLTLWTSGEVGKTVETLPEDVVKRKVVDLLQMFMGSNFTIPQPTAILRSTWHSNPYTRGSYTYDNLQMPNHPNIRQTLGSPLLDSSGTPRVLFAGEATDRTHFSTVHGASDTGYREAMRLLPSSKI